MPVKLRSAQSTVKINLFNNDKSLQTFTMYKDFLCCYSEFFHAALNGSFIEAEEQELSFRDVPLREFVFLQEWLYTQRLSQKGDIIDMKIDMWLLGDRLIASKLQNVAIDGLWQYRRNGSPSATSLRRIYLNPCEGSPLRRFVVDT